MIRRLTEEAQADRYEFERLYGDGNCSCHVRPLCGCCQHPGNPFNQEEDDECWEKGIEVKDLHLTQEGFRHPVEEICEMIQFVRSGGRFDEETLKKHDPHCKGLLVAITKFEDGSLYIRDGFHRVMAVFFGREDGILYDNEYFIEDLTYLRMMKPRLESRYYTPFDPRVEVRSSDFGDFRDQVDKIIQKKQDPLEFIRQNRHVYVRSKKPYHETVEIFAEHWMSKNSIRDNYCGGY